jgi:hypothetical protein
VFGFYIRDEGESVRQGFNFYPPRSWSRGSRGCVLAIGPFRFYLRYSTLRKRMGDSPWAFYFYRR